MPGADLEGEGGEACFTFELYFIDVLKIIMNLSWNFIPSLKIQIHINPS